MKVLLKALITKLIGLEKCQLTNALIEAGYLEPFQSGFRLTEGLIILVIDF